MSDFSVIQAVSAELRRQIVDALDATPGSDFGLDGDPTRIVAARPAADLPSNTVASLYLCHIDIDGTLRNQRPLPHRTHQDLFHAPPLPLKLRFLFTPVQEDEETNLLVLGRVVQHFNDNRMFDTVLGRPVTDGTGGAPARLRVTLEVPPLADLTQLWSAFSTSLRLSVMFVIDIVAIESGRSPVESPRVTEMVHGIGLTGRRGP